MSEFFFLFVAITDVSNEKVEYEKQKMHNNEGNLELHSVFLRKKKRRWVIWELTNE